MLKVLDLFSGIGGFSIGLERTGGFETVAFCEIDPYCRKVLAKHWPGVPIHEDVRELSGAVGDADIITGGFPCQPWSLAGKREGTRDDRDLWPQMRRLVGECKPRWVIGENVPGLDDDEFMGLDRVLSDLESLGYEAGTLEIPACAVDAPHRRSRLWIVGHSKRSERWPQYQARNDFRQDSLPQRPESPDRSRSASEDVAHAARDEQGRQEQRSERERVGPRREPITVSDAAGRGRREGDAHTGGGCAGSGKEQGAGFSGCSRWLPEPDVGRVAYGVPNRVDRLRALGNAVVSHIPEIIGNAILEAEGLR